MASHKTIFVHDADLHLFPVRHRASQGTPRICEKASERITVAKYVAICLVLSFGMVGALVCARSWSTTARARQDFRRTRIRGSRPIFLDTEQSLELYLPEDVQKDWAMYSPYYPSGDYVHPPTGCIVSQVNLIQRHGARFPTSGSGKRIAETVGKLTALSEYVDEKLDFLHNFTYDLGTDDLIPFGAAQSFDAAGVEFERYSRLVSKENPPFVRAASSQRVVDTATNWTAGFAHASMMEVVPQLDLIISEDGNVTLDNSMCPDAGDSDAQTDEWLAVYAPPITNRLNDGAPGANLTDADTYNLMSLCPFHTLFTESPSPFCDLFTDDDFDGFGYSGDLNKFYTTGYGQKLGRVQGVGYVNELLARLTHNPVQDNTQTNRTLDSSPDTFPLNRTFYADFSHDNEMIAIYSALGLFEQYQLPNESLDPSEPDPERTWITWKLVPFSARMVVEKLQCHAPAKDYVRIFVNDAMQTLEFCGGVTGMCSLHAFVNSQGYSRNDDLCKQLPTTVFAIADMPLVDGIQDYFESAENYVHASLSAVSAEMPMISEALHRLWVDVSRFGPTLPDIRLPGLGDFEVPAPPPPPPPPPQSLWDKSAEWISEHPWKASSLGVGIAGVGLLVGYGNVRARRNARLRRRVHASGERRQVVVILGGDIPLALPLILDLEKKGYIVIASVATPEAADEIENKSGGYPATIPIFLRSLASTLSRRFPINAPGDPHASPATFPYIHSIISLLTLPSTYAPPPAPLEHLHLRSDYLSYLNATHFTPLQVIQALLPLLRTGASRARDAAANGANKRSIIFCMPAAEAHVGLSFAAAHAMSAAATLRGAEVLRREIRLAALTGTSESMSDIKVVVVDVGAIEVPVIVKRPRLTYDARQAMDSWTPSEKLAYGPAYESILVEGHRYGVPRKPTHIRVFVDGLTAVVDGGHARSSTIFEFCLAMTYAMASYFPTSILDIVLNLPHFLLSVRNALLPVPPRVTVPSSLQAAAPPVPPAPAPTSAPVPAPAPAPAAATVTAPKNLDPVGEKEGEDSAATSEQELDISETGSEADVESNAGDVTSNTLSTPESSPETKTSLLCQLSQIDHGISHSRVLVSGSSDEGVSLWLVPSVIERLPLERLASQLRPSNPSLKSSSYPTFTPHITLASLPTDTDTLALRESIPIARSSIPVKFSSLVAGPVYFRSVYMAIQLSPALASLHAEIHSKLGIEPRTPSFPHMSLFYIDDEDAKGGERERMVKVMADKGVVSVTVEDGQSGVILDCGAADVNSSNQLKLVGFTGSEIWMVKCEGPVEEWQVLDKIVLATSKH
ncbi:hypothetical protein EW146_g3643 [Bondarzewia mesenterica]|uniref:Uncharacterized protein n=1 Tax=Bondarzewia mesenterica TaxID=1095465 RepID=A0A4S4LYG8_9AGAM|nr:hypothetical protein EW146_g3643 [Bondarzewia mesenterica]